MILWYAHVAPKDRLKYKPFGIPGHYLFVYIKNRMSNPWGDKRDLEHSHRGHHVYVS